MLALQGKGATFAHSDRAPWFEHTSLHAKALSGRRRQQIDLEFNGEDGSVFWHHRDLLLPKVIGHVQGKLGALTHGVEIVPAGLGERVGDYAALALVA